MKFCIFFWRMAAAFFTIAGSIGAEIDTTLMPLMSLASFSSFSAILAVSACTKSSISFLYPAFSSTIFLMASVRSGVLLKNALADFIESWTALKCLQAASPVNASIRLTPAATAPSDTIENIPMRPVAEACVPPQSSTESPNLTTLTLSPYFSPNNAIAPIALASSIVASLFSSSGESRRMSLLTSCSVFSSSSSVILEKCEKSKRK